MRSGVTLEGIPELKVALQKALINHTEAEVRKAHVRAANIIVNSAKNFVPVESGLLRDSIKILPKWRGDPLGTYVAPKVKRSRGKKKEGQKVQEQPYYAAMVEYGTAAHNLGYKGKYVSGTGADHPGSKKSPYMRPALDQSGQAALNAAMEDISKLILSKV